MENEENEISYQDIVSVFESLKEEVGRVVCGEKKSKHCCVKIEDNEIKTSKILKVGL